MLTKYIIICVMVHLVESSSKKHIYQLKSGVRELTPSNFSQHVLQSEDLWIIVFYAPWCNFSQAMKEDYSKAALALKGFMKLGAVNADEHKVLGTQFHIHNYPQIKIFGTNKNNPEDFTGQRTATGLVEAGFIVMKRKVYNHLDQSSDVVELTDATFKPLVLESEDMWIVEFYAPWCGSCKTMAPEWAKAATELKGQVKLGAIDATVHAHAAYQYSIKEYPTFKVFPLGKKHPSLIFDYTGGTSANNIVNWAKKNKFKNKTSQVKQLTGEADMNAGCVVPTVCIVSVLPHISECQADCRNKYLKVLSKLSEENKQNALGWLWLEANSQPDFENMLKIGKFGYPALVIINVKHMRFSSMQEAFSYDGIYSFLRSLYSGQGASPPMKLRKLPAIRQIKPWDGQNGHRIGCTHYNDNNEEL